MTDVSHIITSYSFLVVLIGTSLLGMICGALGSILVFRREALLGDGLAHSALPGVVIAFWCVGNKDVGLFMVGALVSVGCAVAMVSSLVKRNRLPFDGVLAAVLSTFFGLGIMLFSIVQRLGNANQAGIKQFVFGQAATMLERDVVTIGCAAVLALCFLVASWKVLFILAFDEAYGYTLGYNMRAWKNIFYGMVTIGILLSLQAVGVILTSALLIAPSMAARQWCCRWKSTVIMSSLIGGLAAFCGTYTSAALGGVPTGPAIAIWACSFSIVSLCMAPKRGIFYRLLKNRTIQT